MEKTKITISLEIEKWNVVLNYLSMGRFSEVHEIINEIKIQAESQINIIKNPQPIDPSE